MVLNKYVNKKPRGRAIATCFNKKIKVSKGRGANCKEPKTQKRYTYHVNIIILKLRLLIYIHIRYNVVYVSQDIRQKNNPT